MSEVATQAAPERARGTRAAEAVFLDEITIRPVKGWSGVNLRELWRYRELLYFLVWRDLKVRYKQTLLGAMWIIVQPVVSMVVFSILFGGLLGVPSGDVPYPIFAYAALLPWN